MPSPAAATLGVCLVATQVAGEPEPGALPPLTSKNREEIAQEVDALAAKVKQQEARLFAALENPKSRSALLIFAVDNLLRLHRREFVRHAIRKLATKGDPHGDGSHPGAAGSAMPYLLSHRSYHASYELMTAALSPSADDETIKGVLRVYRDVWGTERAKAIFRTLKSVEETKWHPNYDRVLQQFELMPDLYVSPPK